MPRNSSEEQILKEGDIINVDVSTIYQGCFSDSSRMFCIGEVSPEKKRLVEVAKECMDRGIAMVKPWTPIGNMGHAVHQHALEIARLCGRSAATALVWNFMKTPG